MDRCNITVMNYDASAPDATASVPLAIPSTVFEAHLPGQNSPSTFAPIIPTGSNIPVEDSVLPEIAENIETISSELELVFIIFKQPIATRLLYQLSGS